MVIDPWVLDKELNDWVQGGGKDPLESDYSSRIEHIILPYHTYIDGLDKKIGLLAEESVQPMLTRSTIGLRFADLPYCDFNEMAERQNKSLEHAGCRQRVTAEELEEQISWIQNRFGSAITDTGILLDNALKMGDRIILEGAQGCLLDIDQGTFPFVTSSVTSRGNATHGAGIHPGHVDTVIGITKAYITRVGNGHMPTELFDEVGEHLTSVGHEFGTTTGRRRRCGWFDAVVMRHSNRVNGFTEIALTKLDVLGGLDEIKICVGYKMGDVEINEMPASAIALEDCEPVYVTMPGFASHSLEEWLGIARSVTRKVLVLWFARTCPNYIQKLESILE